MGQNIARVLESQGFEYIALDLDPGRIRAARQAGDPVMYGDSSDEEMLRESRSGACQRRRHQLLGSQHLDRYPAQHPPTAAAGARAGSHDG